ncbi:uncharacterized protein LOC132305435 [Cornus florida]|uniref:uncharacterized protein LOC132305435 n=1 Tax=Cornus florida TaxID=4283 RepID=UPI0028A2CE6F|nr:uncharacterized protein LOC132305435 [Cornus florida]
MASSATHLNTHFIRPFPSTTSFARFPTRSVAPLIKASASDCADSGTPIPKVSVLKSALDSFCSMLGLDINLSKSEVYFSGVNDHTQHQIITLLGIQSGTLLVRYLGVPLISTNLKSQHCSLLVSIITHKIRNWTSRSLSYASRLQLINSVLVSTQNYWYNIFILPKGVIDELNKIFGRFLWSGPEMKSSGSKVAWSRVCSPKSAGGLGIPNLEIANKVGIIRFIWDILKEDTNRFHALGVGGFLQLRHPARLLIKHSIGNGANTSFWWDNWAPGGPLCSRFPLHLLTAASFNGTTTVDTFIVDSNWSFPPSFTCAIPELLALPPPCPSRSGQFHLMATTHSNTLWHTWLVTFLLSLGTALFGILQSYQE